MPDDAAVPVPAGLWAAEAVGVDVEALVLPPTVVCTFTGMLIVGETGWP